MTLLSDSLYSDVPGNSEDTQDQTPAAGTWELSEFVGNASYLDDTVVCVVYDPGGASEKILACTHGDSNHRPNVQFVADGVKVLRISLQNDTIDPRVMGVSYTAKQVA